LLYSVGSEVPEKSVDSAALFLFNLFKGDPQLKRAHAEEIRRVLGPFPASAANAASSTVKAILTYLPPDFSQKGDDKRQDKEALMKDEFGYNLTFKYENVSSEEEVRSKSGYDSLSDDEPECQSDTLTQTLLTGIQQSIARPVVEKPVKPIASSARASPYNGEWLKTKCEECVKDGMVGMSLDVLYSGIFELLSSAQESSAIENDVSFRFNSHLRSNHDLSSHSW